MAVDSKWFRDRLADKEVSANAFAELIPIHRSALSKMLNGRQEMSPEVIGAFATFFGEPYETVARHAGLPVPRVSHKSVRVVGLVEKTGRIAKHRGDLVERPPSANDDTVAIAMPGFFDWVAYYTPSPRRVDPDAYGRLSVCELESGTKYLRVLERGKLKALCGADVIEGKVVSAAPVIYIKTV